ncbi:hypothetical protein [Actinokineospora pegani]|uniref:hypothetical protein n=1 Tax=Actinokineospora pegani TaxID=2654637 RepID=UPI0012EA97B8|nr:hypothetical protein [Actinokineospora pegani]
MSDTIPNAEKSDPLMAELKALRRGYGVNAKFDVTTYPCLAEVLRVDTSASAFTAREQFHDRLAAQCDRLSERHRLTAKYALGFDGDLDSRYTDRVRPLQTRFDRDARTVQRRIDGAFAVLCEQLVAAARPRHPWHTNALSTVVTLDGPGADVVEDRAITARVDGLDHIEHSFTVLAPPGVEAGPLDLATVGVEGIAGGDVVSAELRTRNRASFTLRLPKPLAKGEAHRFRLGIRVASFGPFYVCTPIQPCDTFHLAVQFERDRVPAEVLVVDGVLSHEATDPASAGGRITPDPAGLVRTRFDDLELARSYGLLWRTT